MVVAMFAAYVLLGRWGLGWDFAPRGLALVWMPSGLALGGILVLGPRVWPAITLAAAMVLFAELGWSVAVPLLAGVHTVEPLLAAYLVNRYASGRHALQDPRGAVRFAGLVLLAAVSWGGTAVAATLVFAGHLGATQYGSAFFTHLLGSVTGMLVVAPFIVLFSRGLPRWRVDQIAEACAAFALVAMAGLVGFYRFPLELRGFPIEILLMPVLVWPALRLGRRAASVAVVVIAVLAMGGTLDGFGPFVRATPALSLTVVQIFLSATAVMTLALGALSADYGVAEAQLREMVVTDPLTGLPNYRRLLEVLGQQIERADGLKREFAVIFFDMDDLKRINDELGHLAGSRAVCRLAEALKTSLRDADTAARYGGDEFVAVLPDTNREGAELVLARVHAALEADTAEPAVRASAGSAVYPKDGRTPTTLLASADRALYANKAQKGSRRKLVELRQWTTAS